MSEDDTDKESFSLPSNPAKAVQALMKARKEGLVSDGDLATVLIAMPIGALADVGLHLTGIISPGWCAMGAASAALGAKRWVHAVGRQWDEKGKPALPAPPSLDPKEQLRLDTIKVSEALLARLDKLWSEPAREERKRLAAEISLAEDPLLFDAATMRAANERTKNCLRDAAIT